MNDILRLGRPFTARFGILISSVLLVASPAHALTQTTSTWDSASSSAWITGSNWSTNPTAPGSISVTGGTANIDIANFNSAGVTVTIGSGSSNQNMGEINFMTSATSFTYVNSASSTTSGAALNLYNTSNGSSGATAFNGIYIEGSASGNGVTATTTTTETFDAPINLYQSLGFDNDAASPNVTLVIAGNVTNAKAGQTVLYLNGNNSGANTISGVIADNSASVSGSEKLTLEVGPTANGSTSAGGTGKWVLSNTSNSFTGGVIFAGTPTTTGATLSINNFSELGSGANSTFLNGAVIEFGNGNNGSGILSYTGGTGSTADGIAFNTSSTPIATLDQSGTGTLTMSGSVTGTGSSTGKAVTLALTGSTLGVGNFTGSIANTSGTGNSLKLTKSGTGTWLLGGTNTYTGSTAISGGTLEFSNVAAFYNTTAGSLTTGNAALLSVTGAGSTAAFAVGSASSGTTYFQAGDIATLLAHSSFGAGTDIGLDTTNATSGSFTYSAAIANTGAGALGLTKLGTGALVLSGANTYSGGTTVSSGTLYVNNAGGASYSPPATSTSTPITATNTTTSGTGTGSVSVQNTGTLAGSGTIAATSGGIAVLAGGGLTSGGVQSGTTAGTGLTINNAANLSSALTVNGGATLTFSLGSSTAYNGGSGSLNFANPNTNSTYLSLTGGAVDQIFANTGTISNVDLVDLTNGSTGVSLTLRSQNPYLLIQTALGNNADFANLWTTGGEGQNGYVLGVSTGVGSAYTAFNVNAYDINGVQVSSGTNLENLQLYLFNGDLEVVPEPNTWALMLGGMAALVFWQRRRSQS